MGDFFVPFRHPQQPQIAPYSKNFDFFAFLFAYIQKKLYLCSQKLNTGQHMYTFQAFRISKKDNILFPDKLEIDDYKVTYYKGRIFGYESTTIQRNSIGSVSVDAGILFATIYIETNGGQRTVLDGFSKSEARQIQRILSV